MHYDIIGKSGAACLGKAYSGCIGTCGVSEINDASAVSAQGTDVFGNNSATFDRQAACKRVGGFETQNACGVHRHAGGLNVAIDLQRPATAAHGEVVAAGDAIGAGRIAECEGVGSDLNRRIAGEGDRSEIGGRCAGIGQSTGTRDAGAIEGDCVGVGRGHALAVKVKCGTGGDGDRGGITAEGLGAAHLECAAVDLRAAGVGVVAGENERARAVFVEHARATDHAGKGVVAGRAEEECCAVGNVPRVATSTKKPCGADFQCAGSDGGRSGVGVVGGKGECAGSEFGEADRSPASACRVGEGVGNSEIASRGIGRVEADGGSSLQAVVGHRAAQAAEIRENSRDISRGKLARAAHIQCQCGTTSDRDVGRRPACCGAVVERGRFGKLQGARADGCRTRVGVVAGENLRAGAGFGKGHPRSSVGDVTGVGVARAR